VQKISSTLTLKRARPFRRRLKKISFRTLTLKRPRLFRRRKHEIIPMLTLLATCRQGRVFRCRKPEIASTATLLLETLRRGWNSRPGESASTVNLCTAKRCMLGQVSLRLRNEKSNRLNSTIVCTETEMMKKFCSYGDDNEFIWAMQ
jgi:hypothetical protein